MFRSLVPFVSCALVLATAAHADEYQLKNGKRIAFERAKASGDSYTATLMAGGATETVNFTTKDIAQVYMTEPAELNKARQLIAEGKPSEAADAVKPALDKTKSLQSVPGSWWPEAMLIQIDALSLSGKGATGLDGTDDATLRKLPADDADAIREMVQIAGASKDAKQETVDSLKALASHTSSSWIQGRAWLQIGTIYSNQGKVEDAVKANLRVLTFSGAEKDLALRGVVAAARGMQQIAAAKDGIQLLDNYITDNSLTGYRQELLESEKKKLTPKDKTAPKEESK